MTSIPSPHPPTMTAPPAPLPHRWGLLGASAALDALSRRLTALARAADPIPILLVGEPGIPFEAVAYAIHDAHQPRPAAFVALPCAAVPDWESPEAPAQPARARSVLARGCARAREGTLFLDGIEELSLTGQARLMLSLAGLWGDYPTDRLFASVRVIAGTHGDLTAAVERGAFRPDLFRELAPVTVDIPPLRARLENLPRVVEGARRRFNADYALAVDGVTPAALAALAACPWPGNDWHLHRVLEESMLVTQRGWLTPEHLIWRPIPRTPPVVAGLVASAAAAPPGGRGGTPPARPSAATRAALALHLASRIGGISSGDLARACGVSAEAARLDLVALARAGHLQPVGGGRRTRYVPTNAAGPGQDDARDAVAASAAAHVRQEA